MYGGNREIVLRRDNYSCCLCGMTRAKHQETFGKDISVDHKDGLGSRSKIKNNSLDNLWTLCLSCHGKKDINRRIWRKVRIGEKTCYVCGKIGFISEKNLEKSRYICRPCDLARKIEYRRSRASRRRPA